MRAASFSAIVGDYKISDIKVKGEDVGYGSECGQVICADGSWGDTYFYLTEDSGAPADGWYKDMTGDEPVTDEDVLIRGMGFVFSSSADITFTYSGQVISGKIPVNVPVGYCILGNPTTQVAKISDLEVIGEDIGYGSECGQKMLPSGSFGDTYYYLSEDSGAPADGWYKDMTGDEPVTNDDLLEPGDSFVFCSSAEIVIKFPAVL